MQHQNPKYPDSCNRCKGKRPETTDRDVHIQQLEVSFAWPARSVSKTSGSSTLYQQLFPNPIKNTPIINPHLARCNRRSYPFPFLRLCILPSQRSPRHSNSPRRPQLHLLRLQWDRLHIRFKRPPRGLVRVSDPRNGCCEKCVCVFGRNHSSGCRRTVPFYSPAGEWALVVVSPAGVTAGTVGAGGAESVHWSYVVLVKSGFEVLEYQISN
ncbi:hypothetical protein BDD12DRAFT_865181 [Trichophaea hybrida]|nr:hypothetical protein BDD12DRAFT_865181 [Trichophaea hybrida]